MGMVSKVFGHLFGLTKVWLQAQVLDSMASSTLPSYMMSSPVANIQWWYWNAQEATYRLPHTGCHYEADRNVFYHSRLYTNDVSPEVATNITLFSLCSHHPPVHTILPTWYTNQRAIQYTTTQLFRSGDSKWRGAWQQHGKENKLRWQSRQAQKQRQKTCSW